MPQTIIELTTLSPSPENYILYHHFINNKDYFSLKSKVNTGTHFTFKPLEEISIDSIVFQTAENLINAFNAEFNKEEYVPENILNKQNNLNPDPTNQKYPTVTAVNEAIASQITNSTALSNPNIPIVVSGNVHILGVGPGTYPNWGGMVIPAENIGTLQRVDGVYSVSLTPIPLNGKLNVTDVVNTLTSSETAKPLSARQGKFLNETKASKLELAEVEENLNVAISSVASGAPKGTYPNLAALQTAFPIGNDNIYVTLDNGHWYYYNAGWQDGGVYQSALSQIIKSNEDLSLAQRKGDVLYGILDQYTDEEMTLSKVTGTPIIDGVIYFQLGTEYFKRNTNGSFSVKWFGAKGRNGIDDTVAIQKALDSLNGNTLLFDSSDSYYTISDTLVLNRIYTNTSNTILMNSGGTQKTCIRLSSDFPVNKDVISATDIAVGYSILGVVVVNTTMTKRGVGLMMDGICRKFIIDNITFINLYKAFSYGVDCYYNSIKDFEFYQCQYGVSIEVGYPIGSLKLLNGKITECQYGVISNGNCNDVVFTSTILEGCAYPIFVNQGELIFKNCYLGDHCITPITVNGGSVTFDTPTSVIGAALSVQFANPDDTIERQGVLITGGVLTIINATIAGNFVDSSSNSNFCIGNSVKITAGKLIGHNLKYGNSEASTMLRNSTNNTYLDKFQNYVHNGSFKADDISMIEKNIDSNGYNIDCDLTLLNENNGYGGKVVRMKPPTALGKFLGLEIPYQVDNITEVKFIRMKFRSYKNFTQAETANIMSKCAISVQIFGSTQFSNADAVTNGFIMTANTNQSWPGYYILKKVTSTNSYNKDYVQEVVFPVILTSKRATIRVVSLLQNLTSTIGDVNYLDCGIDIFYIALVDKIAGDLICDFTDSFFIPKKYTVSTLPVGTLGDKAIVTDATAPTYLGALTGGGTITCSVMHNGTNWVSN